ncbi:hypothetical protein [Halalkalicoccus salilacus]|uniref:hypothetical protein n=1 Tax=Halalkalicoccus TaxID=332246 RepID=UPI002F968882
MADLTLVIRLKLIETTASMSRYDDLFDEATAGDSVVADKSALDPLVEPKEVVLRTEQEQKLARILEV